MTPLLCAVRRGDNGEVRRLIGLGMPVDYAETPLVHEAVSSRRASLETLSILIEHGADLNALDQLGRPPLFVGKDVATMRLLVEHGADPMFRSSWGHNALSFARGVAEAGYLIGLGVDPNLKSDYGETPFSEAALSGLRELTLFLLTHGADPDVPNWSPLLRVVALGDVGEVGRLLVDGLGADDGVFGSPWHLCVQQGDVRMAEAFVRGGVDVGAPMERDILPLVAACDAGKLEMAKWLVAHGAGVNAGSGWGETPLFAAARSKNPELVAWLLSQGADTEAETETSGRAITNSTDIETVRLLVGAGAKIDFIDGEGDFLTRKAVVEGDVAFLKGLLELGADPNLADHGESALMAAARLDEREMVRILLDAGADPNYQDVDRDTALHGAMSAVVARMLLEAGANAGSRNVMERSPADTARWSEVADVFGACQEGASSRALLQAALKGDVNQVSYLLSMGADPNARTALDATPLMNAADANSLATAEALLRAGADAACVDSQKNNALHYLAGQEKFGFDVDMTVIGVEWSLPECRAFVDRLIEAGANPREANARGHTALETAVLAYRPVVVAALKPYLPEAYVEWARHRARNNFMGDTLARLLTALS